MDLDTGDIFLFQYKVRPGLLGCIEGCIRCMSDSQYSHAAFIWRDPIIPLDALRDVLHPPDTSNGYKHKHENTTDHIFSCFFPCFFPLSFVAVSLYSISLLK